MHSSLITRIFLVAFVTLTDEAAASGGKPEILAARQSSLPVSILSTPTRTTPTSTSQPSITPILLFEPSLAYTACSAGVIQWLFAGPSSRTLTIMVNNDVPQDNPPPPLTSSSSHAPVFTDLLGRQAPTSGSTFPDTVNKILLSTLDPTSDSYSWPSVNIPQGWYQAVTIVPVFGQIAQSDPFYVREEADTSCLITPIPTSSRTSAATSATNTSRPSAMTSGVVVLPESTSSSHIGAIVGGIIGGIAALLLGCFCVCRKHKSQRHSISNSGTRTAANTELNLGSGASPKSLDLSPHPFEDIPFAQRYSTSTCTERHMSSLLSPFSDVAADTSQRHSGALLSVTRPHTGEFSSNHSSIGVPSTALPMYESPPLSPLPPSFHSFLSTGRVNLETPTPGGE